MSLKNSLRNPVRIWDAFWFTPASKLSLHRVCQAFAILATALLVTDLFWVDEWLADDGWFGIKAGRYFIGEGMSDTGSQYRWSILLWMDGPWIANGICLIGILASVLLFLGIAGRWAPMLAWICMMMIHHRAPWLSLSSEVLATAGLAYLSIDAGRASGFWKPASFQGPTQVKSIGANVALRCLQVHWILWVTMSLASMLQHSVWWNGTALEMLGEQGVSWFGRLPSGSTTGQILSVLVLMLHLAVVICLCNRLLRGVGIILTFLLGICYVLLTGDWTLGLAAVCYAMAFVPYSNPEKI